MAKPEQHGPANTLLGQLQRGRGEGYRRALVAPAPDAKRLLVECITNDPRLDRQLENRAAYYAAIAMEYERRWRSRQKTLAEMNAPFKCKRCHV